MTDRHAIRIEIEETHMAGSAVRMHASVGAFHRAKTGLRMVPLKTVTATWGREFCDQMTPGLLRELVTACELVVKNYYEVDQLPFE